MSSGKKLKAKVGTPGAQVSVAFQAPAEDARIDLEAVEEEAPVALAPVASAPVASAPVASLKARKPKKLKEVQIQPSPEKLDLSAKSYRHSTAEEKTAFFADRMRRLSEQEPKVGAAKRALREVVKTYMADPTEAKLDAVLDANRAVQTEECKLSDSIKNPRGIFHIKGLLQRDLNFDLYRQNKTAEPVGSVHTNAFPAEFFFVESVPVQAKMQEAQVASPDAVAEPEEERQLGGTIRTYSSRQIGAIIAAKKSHRF